MTELSTRCCRYSSVVFCDITINHHRALLTTSQYNKVKTTLLIFLNAVRFVCVQFSFQLIVYCFAVTVISTYYFINLEMHKITECLSELKCTQIRIHAFPAMSTNMPQHCAYIKSLILQHMENIREKCLPNPQVFKTNTLLQLCPIGQYTLLSFFDWTIVDLVLFSNDLLQ